MNSISQGKKREENINLNLWSKKQGPLDVYGLVQINVV